MTNQSPILQQIHDRFDTYERYSYTDHTTISNIAIASRPDRYRVTTYPGGIGSRYDGLAIDVHAPKGIFGEADPTRVETSRDYGGLMTVRIEDTVEDKNGLTIPSGTLGAPAAREGLVLPEDPGFHLFTELHNQIKKIKAPMQDVLDVAGIKMNLRGIACSDSTRSVSYNHEEGTATHTRFSTYEVTDGTHTLKINLDGTTQTGLKEKPSDIVVYRSGTTEYRSTRTLLSMDALVAFSGLHGTIKKLYS